MIRPSNILIGVFQQPENALAKWAGRGCNTLVDIAEGQDRIKTLDAASAAGMKALVSPAPNPSADVAHPAFLGWVQPDEPENWPHVPKDAQGNRDFPKAVADYVKKYAALKAVAPNAPIFGNFNGSAVTSAQETYNKPTMADRNILIPEYKQIFGGADWLAGDWYVRNTGRAPEQIGSLTRKMMNLMRAWSGGQKPLFVFIECGLQGLNKPGAAAPTPAEMRANIWTAIILGSMGVIYFPAKVAGGFQFDVTPVELVAEMVLQNQALKSAEPWLLNGARTMRVETDFEFGATWRLADGTEMTADVRWDAASGRWSTVISIPDQTAALRARVAALEARLARIDAWRAGYPSN